VETFGVGGSWFARAEDVIATLLPELREGVTVYVKGSRVNRLERVVAALVPGGATQGGGH
jgi:UDP-N-acetylmuramoyl-tripeptide--D-alanyl-D-alanine ligase